MNRKKLISVGLTAAMLTGLLAGCGDSSQNSSQNGSGSEPVVLQWWGSFPENMGPNQVCEAFNKIDPNLQVEYTRFVNDDAGNTKLDVSLMSDSSIDVCLDPLDEKRGEKKYALRQEQYGKFLIQLFNLWYEDWEKNEQPYIRQFDNYIAILLGYQPESCEQRGTCGIQNVVEADGSVFPCDFYMTDDYYIGNYNYDQTETIDEKRREIGFVARSTNISDECRECKFIKICRNGCQRCRDKDDITGKYRNYFCESYKMFFDECLDKMEYIASYIAKKN